MKQSIVKCNAILLLFCTVALSSKNLWCCLKLPGYLAYVHIYVRIYVYVYVYCNYIYIYIYIYMRQFQVSDFLRMEGRPLCHQQLQQQGLLHEWVASRCNR